jgi:hypothetical protein
MVHAFALLLALSHPADAAQSRQATFVPVCRDGRGEWDRRACRHVRRNDPSRLTLALADGAPVALG